MSRDSAEKAGYLAYTRHAGHHLQVRWHAAVNGPEFVAQVTLRWLSMANIEKAYVDLGKPEQNAAGASFDGRFRDERLSLEWFRVSERCQGCDRRLAARL